MTSLDIALVSRDPEVRMAAARAFDRAPASWRVGLHRDPPPHADAIVFGVDMRETANGHIVFDPSDEADLIDEVRRSVASARNKVFVISGAGRGVGVTSLALHLAASAARQRTTCFFDLDVKWGAAARLGVESPHKTWADAADEETLRLAAVPVTGGFRALLAPRTRGENDPQACFRNGLDVLARAAEIFERVVVDCSEVGWIEAALGLADAAVLVVPATMPGALRAAELLDEQYAVPWAVALNHLGAGGETARAALHRTIGRRSAVELPCTPALRDREDEGALLTSPWARYVQRSNRLLGALEAGT